MSIPDNQVSVAFIDQDFEIPDLDEEDLFKEVLNERARLTARVVNQKENGLYPLIEVLNGQEWFSSDPQVFRDGFRTVIETGVLTTGANPIPHGLTITNFKFTNIFGFITDGTLHVPIVNGDGGTGDSINVTIDASDINITITAGYNLFSGDVTLEYVKTL